MTRREVKAERGVVVVIDEGARDEQCDAAGVTVCDESPDGCKVAVPGVAHRTTGAKKKATVEEIRSD